MIIAIDGPAASGKGTLARRLARRFGLTYLDTGALYRAVGASLIKSGEAPDDEAAAVAAASGLSPAKLEDPTLRTAKVGQAASIVAALPAVRQALLAYQRDVAAMPPGAVLDGRDIGTVICPDADVKLFVTASIEARAERRHLELSASGRDISVDEVQRDLQERDERDSHRAEAPLVAATDAYLLDTSNLDIEAAFQAAVSIVETVLDV
jgi:cytidylate kinase